MIRGSSLTLVGAVLTGAISGGIGAFLIVDPALENVTIVRTEAGFEPAHVRIKQGGTITFTSIIGKQFWPASNSHPLHDSYSDFDPKRSLGPDEEWSFTFDRTGMWGFHDHLAPQALGTIEVVGSRVYTLEECLETTGTVKAVCWEQDLQKILKTEGLSAALDAFVSMYDENPEFRKTCHDVMHILGRAAYRDFNAQRTTISRDATRYCGFGFYHGFIEEVFAHKGPDFLDEGPLYCESLLFNAGFSNRSIAERASGSCYHGLGHAIFDSLDGQLWGDADSMMAHSVDTCERLMRRSERREQCVSGVSNALAIAYVNKYYQLSFDDERPFSTCQSLVTLYQPACFAEIGISFLSRDENFVTDISDLIAFHESMPTGLAEERFVLSVIDDEVRGQRRGVTLSELSSLCDSLTSQNLQAACYQGIFTGLRDSSEPGREYVAVLDFCGALDGQWYATCVSFAESLIVSLYNIELVPMICREYETYRLRVCQT